MKKLMRDFKNECQENKRNIIIISLSILVLVLFLSIGFASFSKNLGIDDIVAEVRIEDDVRVSKVSVSSANNALTNWEEYNVSNISGGVSLPNADSTVTYNVEILVLRNREYGILNISGLPENLEYEISGYQLEDKICDNDVVSKCNLGAKKNIDIIIKYKDGGFNPDNTDYSFVLNFDFKRIFEIKYDGLSGANLPKEVMEGKRLEVSFLDNYGIEVYMGNAFLTELTDYTYKNKTLNIFNVDGDITIRRFTRTLGEAILDNNSVSSNCPTQMGDTKYYEFVGADTNTKFCKAEDDYGDTYYFRGKTENNYVNFAGIKWRIIRINGDGTVRLTTEEPVVMTSYYDFGGKSDSYGSIADEMRGNTGIGYMNNVGGSSTNYLETHQNIEDSNLKETIDKWYEEKILGKYDNYIADTYFCNDRSVFDENYGELQLFQNQLISHTTNRGEEWGVDTGLGYGNYTTYYGAWYRLAHESLSTFTHANQHMTYTCYNKNDRFTVNDTDIGNGALKYPVGTVTMDDIIFAGSKYGDFTSNYETNNAIKTTTRYWTMTPGVVFSDAKNYKVGMYYPNGYVTFEANANVESGARPVINIKDTIYVAGGHGTSSDPYRLTDKNVTTSEIEDRINEMTLDEKIGQMIIVSASGKGTSLSESFKEELETIKPGGVILFGDNIQTSTKLKNYISDIKATSTIPMFISVDQEGGRVQRLKSLTDVSVTDIPPMYDIGLTNNQNLAYDIGRVIGEELGVFGFNMDFAPVADVWSNPDNPVINNRSFGNDADTVSKMSVSVANGIYSTGVIPVYKHFPGHGDTSTDTHTGSAVINKTKEELEELEIVPFKNAIKSGAKAIMIGHLDVPALTGVSGLPATLSSKLINEYLRNELGYNGVVITDGLNMKAITDYCSNNNLSLGVEGVNAGIDIFLGPTSPTELFNQIKQGVLDGKISEETINKAVRRILKLKEDTTSETYDKSYLNNDDHQGVIQRVYSGVSDDYPEFNIDYKTDMNSYIQSLSSNQVNNEFDGYRYVSKDANNYVLFNGERWRIIGSFNETVHGQSGYLTKIVKNDSIGNYPWDSGNQLDWSKSSSYSLLNTTYYNTLYSNSKTMIQSSQWHLSTSINSMWKAIGDVGPLERTGNMIEANIGLIYVSDYLLAAPSSTCARTVHARQGAYDSSSNNCALNNWFNFTHNEDTFVSINSYQTAGGNQAVQITNGDYAQFTGITSNFAIYPTLYLKSSVKIVNGDGTFQYPYVLEYTS